MKIMKIICDIEGTTTSISFVKDILFPYAYDNCEKYLNEHYNEEKIEKIIEELRALSIKDETPISDSSSKETVVQDVTSYVQQLIKKDLKVKPMKELQGMIWRDAYENGSIKGHVYEDVPECFKSWTEKGLKLYIYSSGSVEAQKLLFKYSDAGDLTKYLSGYFDTSVGYKQESQSYIKILEEIAADNPSEVLFLSDIPGEVIAAAGAQINCLILDRPNNPTTLTNEIREKFKIVQAFTEIDV